MTGEEDTIIRMWAEGVSTTKIGEVLGISRSAICGRMHRMRARGVDLREPKEKKPNGRTHLAHKPPVRREYSAALIIEPTEGVSIVDLAPWHCRAVTPEYDSTLYCGALKRDGSSYCDDHHQLYHLPKKSQTPA